MGLAEPLALSFTSGEEARSEEQQTIVDAPLCLANEAGG